MVLIYVLFKRHKQKIHTRRKSCAEWEERGSVGGPGVGVEGGANWSSGLFTILTYRWGFRGVEHKRQPGC
jgi:hypothetical protein